MKAIDFICDLFFPRKPVGSIIRNKVLEEVENEIKKDGKRQIVHDEFHSND